MQEKTEEHYLSCEHRGIFFLLMMTSGMLGAYTFTQRGGVFCNAQTANIVMMSIALGQGHWQEGLYYIIPITAYIAGAFISEILPTPVKRSGRLRWDTWLIGIELLSLFVIGFVPLSVPHRVVQVIISFLASMQYNTFRQAEGIPMATTFCTNHVRQLGIALAKICRKHSSLARLRLGVHARMLLGFLGGGMLVSFAGSVMHERAIWLSLIPLGIIFVNLLIADLKTELAYHTAKPHGH